MSKKSRPIVSYIFASACSVMALMYALPASADAMVHPEKQLRVKALPRTPLLKAALAAPTGCNTPTTKFCDALMNPTPGWTGNVFHLAQDYPAAAPADAQPWLKFDPVKQPLDYLNSVRDYFYEGNLQSTVESSFDPTLNKVRQWYNAPWQDFGTNGREFVHGLTRERVSLPGELGPLQKSYWNNYAVGFYNAPGGMIIGKVWADHGNPNVSMASMPEGTVAAKLLFTTASVDEVPYLAGSPEWDAYIYTNIHGRSPKETDPRSIIKVRLLQIDIAVKDSRVANTTGWVFGTYVYGGGPNGPSGSGWTNVAPVGSSWGNDPTYAGTGPVGQQLLNPAVNMPHVGYQGRLNGPVDNPASSCLSCHSTAQIPRAAAMYPSNPSQAPLFFRNVPAEVAFDNDGHHTSTDYSLQLAGSISNFQAYEGMLKAMNGKSVAALNRALAVFHAAEANAPRNGGPVD